MNSMFDGSTRNNTRPSFATAGAAALTVASHRPPASRKAPGSVAPAEAAAGPRLVPILDAAEDDPWRFGWLDSSIELRRGLCVREDPSAWPGR